LVFHTLIVKLTHELYNHVFRKALQLLG